MAVFKYTEPGLSPEVSVSLSEINEYSLRAKAMLTALGDYWTNYYKNLSPIAVATTGSVASISREYTHLLDIIKSSNILDIPIQQSDQFELLVIDCADVQPVYDEEGVLSHFFIPLADVVDTQYLTTSLFESRVVLVQGKHFDVVQGKGYKFYVDLFGDTGITDYAYEVGEASERHILLWACDIAFSSTVIYERYGRFLYKKSIDSEKYKWVVTALMRFYETTKTVQCIQDVLNIMYGIPYTRYDNETITDIYYVDVNLQRITSLTAEEPYICISTDKADYYTYAFSDVKYKVGDVVPKYSLLADFNRVEDYITNPGWWEHCAFPSSIVEGADELTPAEQNELMDKVLKYNTVHLNLGVSVDSYATYLSQVKEIFSIIESGFPVYLYPLVDTFVRARFIDKEDMDDAFALVKADFRFACRYDWGQMLTFDGTVPYSMGAVPDCGSEAEYVNRTFDSSNTYCDIGRADGIYTNVRQYDGTGIYSVNYKYYPNNDREYLKINVFKVRVSDEYIRNKKLFTTNVFYNGNVIADGSHNFNGVITTLDDEFLTVKLTQKPLIDTFGDCSESSYVNIKTETKEYFNNCVFDGSNKYDIILSGGEYFTFNVSRREI